MKEQTTRIAPRREIQPSGHAVLLITAHEPQNCDGDTALAHKLRDQGWWGSEQLPAPADPLAYTLLRSLLPWGMPELYTMGNLSWLNSHRQITQPGSPQFLCTGWIQRYRNLGLCISPLAFFTPSLPWEWESERKSGLDYSCLSSPPFRGQRQEGGEFETSLDYIVRLCCQSPNDDKPRPKQNRAKAPLGV